jgi:hypothetical protein
LTSDHCRLTTIRFADVHPAQKYDPAHFE